MWLQKGDPTRPLRGVDTILIEFCASEDSEFIKNVPCGSVALRIAESEDFTKVRTLNAVLDVVCLAKRNAVKNNCLGRNSVHFWLSVEAHQQWERFHYW